MGVIQAICLSEQKGTAKTPVECAVLIKNHGLQDDAHAGTWHRQVSLLADETIQDFNALGASVTYGAFGENLVVSQIPLTTLPIGTRLVSGTIILEVTQIGKVCHTPCQIHHRIGHCIMPTQGVFAKVIQGGILHVNDTLTVISSCDAISF